VDECTSTTYDSNTPTCQQQLFVCVVIPSFILSTDTDGNDGRMIDVIVDNMDRVIRRDITINVAVDGLPFVCS
jgi:hypothetical protein